MVADSSSGLLMVALLCLQYRIQPEDLDWLANHLAEFDAVNDAKTEGNESWEF